MKKYFISLTVGITILTGNVFAQKMTQGKFQYHIDVTPIKKTEQSLQMVGMLYGSSMTIHFQEKKARVHFKMGRISENVVILDEATDSCLNLVSNVQGNFAQFQPLAFANQESNLGSAITVDSITNEFKTILGYKCQKILCSDETTQIEYWVTEEIVLDENLPQQVTNPALPGFPVEFSKSNEEYTYKYQLTNIVRTVEKPEEVFSFKIPPGYKLF